MFFPTTALPPRVFRMMELHEAYDHAAAGGLAVHLHCVVLPATKPGCGGLL